MRAPSREDGALSPLRGSNRGAPGRPLEGLTRLPVPVSLSLVKETTDKRLTDYADCAG